MDPLAYSFQQGTFQGLIFSHPPETCQGTLQAALHMNQTMENSFTSTSKAHPGLSSRQATTAGCRGVYIPPFSHILRVATRRLIYGSTTLWNSTPSRLQVKFLGTVLSLFANLCLRLTPGLNPCTVIDLWSTLSRRVPKSHKNCNCE